MAARFLPVWLATVALVIIAAIAAPDALGHTSWSYILPNATVLAIASLGQMLVVLQGGIDLSTPGVMAAAGNLVAGVGAGSDHKLPVAILAALGVGVLVGLTNGVLVGVLRLNPLIVTLAVGLIVLAWSSKYSRDVVTNRPNVPSGLSSWATSKPYDVSRSSLIEAVRVICEEPPRSLRSTMSGRRRLDPDIETIVGKALEKDANRRYASAAAMAEDVDRYLVAQYTAAG